MHNSCILYLYCLPGNVKNDDSYAPIADGCKRENDDDSGMRFLKRCLCRTPAIASPISGIAAAQAVAPTVVLSKLRVIKQNINQHYVLDAMDVVDMLVRVDVVIDQKNSDLAKKDFLLGK